MADWQPKLRKLERAGPHKLARYAPAKPVHYADVVHRANHVLRVHGDRGVHPDLRNPNSKLAVNQPLLEEVIRSRAQLARNAEEIANLQSLFTLKANPCPSTPVPPAVSNSSDPAKPAPPADGKDPEPSKSA